MFYIQPSLGTLSVAKITPVNKKPEELDIILGRMEYESGSPPGVSGWEIGENQEWYLKVIPGDCDVMTSLSPYEADEERGFARDMMSRNPKDSFPDTYDLCKSYWLGRNFIYNAPFTYISEATIPTVGALGTLGRGELGYFIWTENDYFSWEVSAEFSSVGDTIELAFWRQWDPTEYSAPSNGGNLSPTADRWTGVQVIRETTNELVFYTVEWTGSSLVSQEILRKVHTHWSEEFWVGASRYPSSDLQCRIRYLDQWEGPYEYTLDENLVGPSSFANLAVDGWRSPVLSFTGTTKIHQVFLASSGIARFKYALPEQYYGNIGGSGGWSDEFSRYKLRVESPSFVGDRELQTEFTPLSIESLVINGSSVTVDQLDIQRNHILVPSSVSPDDEIEVSYYHQDVGFVYRGYMDDGKWVNCDLNPNHPWSPLFQGESVYLYIKPIESRLLSSDLTGGLTSFYERGITELPLYHTTEPVHSMAHQLLAVVALKENQVPLIEDLRKAPTTLDNAGVWNEEDSFEGPSYSEGGALIIEVPEGRAEEAYGAAAHAVAAGVKVIVIEDNESPLSRLGDID